MGMFDFLNPGKPYKAAQKQYQKGWEQTQNYEKPYWQSGMDQISKLTGAEDKLMNPGELQNEWASGYEMSPYAKQLQEHSMSQGMDAASGMGLLGSSTALQALQSGSSNIMQKDREKYMDDLMQKYMTGIGMGQNMYNTGANMGSQLGNQSMDFGNKMGEAKFGEQQAKSQMMKDIVNMLARAGMAYGTGGMSELGYGAMSGMDFGGKKINFSTPEPGGI